MKEIKVKGNTNNIYGTELVYKFGWYKTFIDWILRTFCFLIVLGASLNYSKDHGAAIFFISIFGFIFLRIGSKIIYVYEDRVVFRDTSFLKWRNTTKTFHYKDLNHISLEGGQDPISEILASVFSMMSSLKNRVKVELNDGNTQIIVTDVFKAEIKKGLDYINQRANIS